MLRGNIWIEGAPVLSNLVFLLGFFTLIMSAAQEEGMIVPTLDLFHTFISWPSFNEGAILSAVVWCFRNIERVLGSKILVVFLAYNLVLFLPVFSAVIYFKGFNKHYSLFYFVPYSIYAYTAWHIPASPLISMISDKFLISFMIVIDLAVSFPYGFGALLAGALGTFLWRIDLLRLKRLCERTESQANDRVEVQPLEAEPQVDAEKVRSIVEMGFSEAQAVEALRAADGDVQRAIDTLLGGMS
jgi:NACalpha-BTF3-like transcription factor